MTEIRESIKRLVPRRVLDRPVDHRGYPVPWFVTEKDAEDHWEFRVLNPQRYVDAIKQKVCWICGHSLGTYKAFAVGPMCGVNRISGEPPQHLECATFAAKACPFMLLPNAQRREHGIPNDAKLANGGLHRNPGVMMIWSTKTFRIARNGTGFLWQLGDATDISFWRAGVAATRQEIDESVAGGLPALEYMAFAQGGEAPQALARALETFNKLLPPAVTA